MGDEWLFILSGYATTGDNISLGSGDVLHSKKKSKHALDIGKSADCVLAFIVMNGVAFYSNRNIS